MNPAISEASGSVIRSLHGKRRPTSINLGIGEPTLLPNVAHFENATAWVAEHGCRYSTNIGDADLRAAIAAHYAYPGLDAPDNVCITTGSQEAVYVALRTLVDPETEEVLVIEPAFPVYGENRKRRTHSVHAVADRSPFGGTVRRGYDSRGRYRENAAHRDRLAEQSDGPRDFESDGAETRRRPARARR